MRLLAAMQVRHACGIGFVVLALSGVGAGTEQLRLVDAVKSGDRNAVRALLTAHVDPNAGEPDGTTPLHWAVRSGDVATARLLLNAGARATTVNRYNVRPIALAAANGDARMLALLLEAGADANAAGPDGETPLMTAARTGNVDAVSTLVGHGADVNAVERWQGESALMWAGAANAAGVVELLIQRGAAVDARSAAQTFARPSAGLSVLPRGRWTAVMYAARQGAVEAVRALADGGADLNLADADGATALSIAIINAHYSVAGLLLVKGADPNVADATGTTPLYEAVDMNTLAWMFGRPDPVPTGTLSSLDVIKLLLDRGADPNAALTKPQLQRHHTPGDPALGEGATPFMRAAKAGDATVMRLLLDWGADPLATQANGTTPLIVAAGLGWRDGNMAIPTRDRGSERELIEAIGICLEYGADINAANRDGETALHAAAARAADDIVRFLVSRGARLDARNKDGLTPLDVALGKHAGRGGPRRAHPETAALLRQLMGLPESSDADAPSTSLPPDAR